MAGNRPAGRGVAMTARRVVTVALAAALLLGACGSNRQETARGSETSRVVKIGLIGPLSGSLSAQGVGMRNSADLAGRQANDHRKIAGWTLVLAPQDDQAVSDVGA